MSTGPANVKLEGEVSRSSWGGEGRGGGEALKGREPQVCSVRGKR